MFLHKSDKKRKSLEKLARRGKKRLDNIHSAVQGENERGEVPDRYRLHDLKR